MRANFEMEAILMEDKDLIFPKKKVILELPNGGATKTTTPQTNKDILSTGLVSTFWTTVTPQTQAMRKTKTKVRIPMATTYSLESPQNSKYPKPPRRKSTCAPIGRWLILVTQPWCPPRWPAPHSRWLRALTSLKGLRSHWSKKFQRKEPTPAWFERISRLRMLIRNLTPLPTWGASSRSFLSTNLLL